MGGVFEISLLINNMRPNFGKLEDGVLLKEQILDETSTIIARELSASVAAKEILNDALAGKSVLLVDSVLGKFDEFAQNAIDRLNEQGWEELTRLIIQKAFGRQFPRHEEMFRRFLGQELKVIDVRKKKQNINISDREIGMMMLSGSPANVTDALTDPHKKVLGEEFPHGYVYNKTVELYRAADELNIPIIGICYGHQVLSAQRGSEIYKLPSRFGGRVAVETTNTSHRLVAGVLGAEWPLSGEVPVSHGDAVKYNPRQSALFLTTSGEDPAVTHGLIHIPDKPGFPKLSGDDIDADAQTVHGLLVDGLGVALSVQGHPEMEQGRLLEFAINRDVRVFKDTEPRQLGVDYLMMMAKFVQKYGSVKN